MGAVGGGGVGGAPVIVWVEVPQEVVDTFLTQTSAMNVPELEVEWEFVVPPGVSEAAKGLSPKFQP